MRYSDNVIRGRYREMIKTLWDGSKEITYSELQDLKAGICPVCDTGVINYDDVKIHREGHYGYYCEVCETHFAYKGG